MPNEKVLKEAGTQEIVKHIKDIESAVEELDDFENITVPEVEEAFSGDGSGEFSNLIQDVADLRKNATETESGLMSAADKKRLDEINDYTTGINLLRGTRDFKQGYEKISTSRTYCKDGFDYMNDWTFYRDSDGFVVASHVNSALSYTRLHSSYIDNLKRDDVYTLSFEFMIGKDVVSFGSPSRGAYLGTLFLYNEESTANNGNKDLYTGDILSIEVEKGKWIKAKYSFTLEELKTSNTKYDIEDSFLVFEPTAREIGTTSFKKVKIERGNINNPIWSPSPFDVDRINDETTGINLIRGSREFIQGKINNPKNSVVYTDGFTSIHNFLNRYLDENGFAVLQGKSTADSGIYSSSYDGHIEPGTPITFFFDFKINSQVDSSKSIASLSIYNKTASLANSQFFIDGNTDIGRWYTKTLTINATNDYNKETHFALCRIVFPKDVNIEFRKLGLYIGRINNPVWSASPFDVAQVSDQNAHPNGTYAGVSIADKFKNEIGSTHIATWLQSRVKAANFTGLNIMDYVDVVLDGVIVRYRIAAIDPYYTTNVPQNGHHIYFMPTSAWKVTSDDADYLTDGALQWNKKLNNNGTSENEAPYLVSNLHKWEIEKHLTRFPQEWQNAMIDLNVYLETRYSSGTTLESSSGRINAKLGKIFSPSEAEIFGHAIAGTKYHSESHDAFLPRFNSPKDRYIHGVQYWTRTVADGSSKNAIMVGTVGNSSATVTDNKYVSPLPCFAIG